jgi:hypothetical protein
MYPVSTGFKTAVRESHTATVRVEVWRSGVFMRSLNVTGGQVEIDSRRQHRSTISLTIPATKPTVVLDPVFTTYSEIKGLVVTWDIALDTWATAGAWTWAEGNSLDSSGVKPLLNSYADLAGGYPNYGALRDITGYSETTVDDGLIPTTAASDLAPYGNEVHAWRGIRLERSNYLDYEAIAGLKISWDLVQSSLTWATVDSGLTWADGNDLPI